MVAARGRGLLLAVVLATLGLAWPGLEAAAETRFAVELEAGALWQSRNDVQIPNDEGGTRFSLEELAGGGPWPAGRASFTWELADRHGVRLLLAPLAYTETGVLDEAVSFAGAEFEAGLPTEASYRFNSWRVGYRYRLHEGPRWSWWVGATAKVRDARIELRQGATASHDSDVGFVPLVHLSGSVVLAPRWRASLEVEAIAGGPGRAEDVALKLAYELSEEWSVSAGYRTVEGGADTDDVYSFAWFNSAVASVAYRF